MERSVGLLQSILELLGSDGTPPQEPVGLRARRNDSQPAASPSRHSPATSAFDHCRINFVLGAVAVDRGSRRSCDDRSDPALHCPPYKPIDQRIFERG
jgi:hypothetical protein